MEMSWKKGSCVWWIFSWGKFPAFILFFVIERDGLFEKLVDVRIEGFLDVSWFENDIVNVLVKKLLGVEIEIVMLFAFAEELLFQTIFAFA